MHRKDTQDTPSISLETLLKLKKHEQPGEEFWEAFDQQLHQRTLQTLISKQSLTGRLRAFFSVRFHPAMPAALAAFVVMALAVPGTVSTIAHQTTPETQEALPQISHQSPADTTTPANITTPTAATHYVVDKIEGSQRDGQQYTVAASNTMLSSSNVRYISGKLMAGEFSVSHSTPIAAVY